MKSKSEFKRVATQNPLKAAEEWWKTKEENERLREQVEDLSNNSQIYAMQMACAETSQLENDFAALHVETARLREREKIWNACYAEHNLLYKELVEKRATLQHLNEKAKDYEDALVYCNRRSQVELEAAVAQIAGDDTYYNAVLKMIHIEARLVLEKWRK